ncbi:MAG: hypothetical protein QNJ18_20295 [Xenococcaceae cyanobacterium MO_167.B52]|nr:hypothetical protein [Xenococcaceae cyanobacterium MO_167.B52]
MYTYTGIYQGVGYRYEYFVCLDHNWSSIIMPEIKSTNNAVIVHHTTIQQLLYSNLVEITHTL